MTDWRDRLEQRREELGYTRAELARRAGIKPTMLHDVLDRGVTPSVANLFKIARSLNFSLSELYEGVVGSQEHKLNLTGVYEGGSVLSADAAGERPDFSVSFPRSDLESIKVRGDLLETAGYRRGDVLMGVRHAADGAGNLIGRDCIVALPSGERVVALLHKRTSPTRYNLRFFHRSQPDREDVEIAWAAPISMIVRD